ncbi:3'-phosphoadenosine 5'-phosphosulfate sulfotransferase [Coemansia javaensis]|uniref:FAD synthase n=1 Tax=Coemansia javaensis TaxID=2761396 RepID=A0A9W8LJA0_9FUNG|nr:3'-phosphoadenosine 5'-phosphosulfate sulfotransferase [Coemansia javaensis]
MVSRTGVAELDFAALSDATYRLAAQPTRLGAKVAHALAVIEQAAERYGPAHVALSFNGGKDCTALMHLVRAALSRYEARHGLAATPLVSLYVLYKRSFAEIDEFVQQSVVRYSLELVERAGPMKQGLQSFKDDYPHIQAVFVGTRRDDPYGGGLDAFTPTDADWPQFMRVNPVLDWGFDDVWGFLHAAGAYYCPLYDQGYTSLGDVDSTTRNPALLKDGRYQPAWSLADGGLERSGRSSSSAASGLPVPARGHPAPPEAAAGPGLGPRP